MCPSSNELWPRVSPITIDSPLSIRSLSSSTDIRGTSTIVVGGTFSTVVGGTSSTVVGTCGAPHELKNIAVNNTPIIVDTILILFIYLYLIMFFEADVNLA